MTELTRTIDRLKTGNARAPALSPAVVELAREGWLIASLDTGASRLRSGHLVAALLLDEELSRAVRDSSPRLVQIPAEALRRKLASICASSVEEAPMEPLREETPPSTPQVGASASPALDQFTIDLTERARAGAIDPVLGRDSEIRQVIDILMRRRQNNPILTGEAGVGKTAIVEGLALAIVKEQVPPPLRERVSAHPRSGALAGRRRRQGRVRESAQIGDRRGRRPRRARSSCSSTRRTR